MSPSVSLKPATLLTPSSTLLKIWFEVPEQSLELLLIPVPIVNHSSSPSLLLQLQVTHYPPPSPRHLRRALQIVFIIILMLMLPFFRECLLFLIFSCRNG